MRTFFFVASLVALSPGLVHAQAAPAQPPRVIMAAPPPAQSQANAAPPAQPAEAASQPSEPAAAAPATAATPEGSAQDASPQAAPAEGDAAPEAAPLPPPGYAYESAPPGTYPTFDPARRNQIYGELNLVDERLRELQLERSRVSLGGPIAMLATGYGIALVSAAVALASFATAEAIENDDWWDRDEADWNDDGWIDEDDERAARNTARVFTGLAAVGLGVGIGGTVLLSKRLAERRVHAPEIHDLKERRRDLRRELRYGANLAPDSATVSVSGRF